MYINIYDKIRLYADMQELLFDGDMCANDEDIKLEIISFIDALENNGDISHYIDYIKQELSERATTTERDKEDFIKLTRIMLTLEELNK